MAQPSLGSTGAGLEPGRSAFRTNDVGDRLLFVLEPILGVLQGLSKPGPGRFRWEKSLINLLKYWDSGLTHTRSFEIEPTFLVDVLSDDYSDTRDITLESLKGSDKDRGHALERACDGAQAQILAGRIVCQRTGRTASNGDSLVPDDYLSFNPNPTYTLTNLKPVDSTKHISIRECPNVKAEEHLLNPHHFSAQKPHVTKYGAVGEPAIEYWSAAALVVIPSTSIRLHLEGRDIEKQYGVYGEKVIVKEVGDKVLDEAWKLVHGL